jgi:hypothetical protein
MSTPDPYEQYRAALSTELRRVAPVVRRQRRRRIAALGAATVGLAAAGTAVVVLAPTTGSRLDVIAQARAAIASSSDAIVHYSVWQSDNAPRTKAEAKRARDCKATPPEVWMATADGPPHYRYRIPQSPCVINDFGGRIVTGDLEIAYGDRTSTVYSPNDGFAFVKSGLPASYDEQQPPLPTGDSRFSGADDARDPVAAIRAMLSAGQLRDAGPTRGDHGRALRKLVGSSFEDRGDPAHPRKSKVSVVYEVDANTFAPVLIATTAEQTVPKDPDLPLKRLVYLHRMITQTLRFSTYETLPLTPANEKLLTIPLKPGTKVTPKEATAEPVSAAEKARAKKIIDAQIAAGLREPGYGLR